MKFQLYIKRILTNLNFILKKPLVTRLRNLGSTYWEIGIKCILFNEISANSPDALSTDFCPFYLLKRASGKQHPEILRMSKMNFIS